MDIFAQENPRNECPQILSFLNSINSPVAPCGMVTEDSVPDGGRSKRDVLRVSEMCDS